MYHVLNVNVNSNDGAFVVWFFVLVFFCFFNAKTVATEYS